MEVKEFTNKIMYNNYIVIGATKIDHIIFVKAYNKTSGKIYWFLGFDSKQGLMSDIKRILMGKCVRTNSFFRDMFKDDVYKNEVAIRFGRAEELMRASKKVENTNIRGV